MVAELQVVDFAEMPWEASYGAPFCEATGSFEARRAKLDGYSLWALNARLRPGAALRWPARHPDEVVAVLAGSLVVDGGPVPAGGSVVVEADAVLTADVTEDTEILHYGPEDPAAPAEGAFGPAAARPAGAKGYHLQGPLGREHRSMEFEGNLLESAFHADSTCPTCRPTLLRVSARGAMTFPSHFHCQDELIYVVSGGFKVGPLTAKPGMLLGVPADRRYGIRGDGPFEFLNYRRDVSTIVIKPNDEPALEIAEGRGYVPSPTLA
jgi:hypothetical protein